MNDMNQPNVEIPLEKERIAQAMRDALRGASLLFGNSSSGVQSNGVPFIDGTELTLSPAFLAKQAVPALARSRAENDRPRSARHLRDGYASCELIEIARQRGVIPDGAELTIVSSGIHGHMWLRAHEWDLSFDDSFLSAIKAQLVSDHATGVLPAPLRRFLSPANKPCELTRLFKELEQALLARVTAVVGNVLMHHQQGIGAYLASR